LLVGFDLVYVAVFAVRVVVAKEDGDKEEMDEDALVDAEAVRVSEFGGFEGEEEEFGEDGCPGAGI
jgi:hypothetical protein